MKTTTVAQILEQLHSAKHQKAVWAEIIEFLYNFIDKDGVLASKTILDEDTKTAVTQDVILGVMKDVKDIIEPLGHTIRGIESFTIDKGEVDDGKKKVVKKPARKVSIRAKEGPKNIIRDDTDSIQ